MTPNEIKVFRGLLEFAERQTEVLESEVAGERRVSIEKMIEQGDLPEIEAARNILKALASQDT